jgi:hypothetical protein
MTVATTRGTKKTVDEMVLAAYKLAGLLDAGASTSDGGVLSMLNHGRFLLGVILEQLSAIPTARDTDFYELTLVADTQSYTLPEEIIDVVGDGKYIEAGVEPDSSLGETVVKQIDRSQWQLLSGRDATGIPSMMYVHRGVEDAYTITLYLWTRPSEAGTIRLMVQRAAADTTVGSTTIDIKTPWYAYILHELASQVCQSSNGNVARATYLAARAMEYKNEARNFSAEHGPVKMSIMLQPVQTRGGSR